MPLKVTFRFIVIKKLMIKNKKIAKNMWKLTTEIIQENIPQKFWYYHNGITFFVENNDEAGDVIFETMGSVLTIDPKSERYQWSSDIDKYFLWNSRGCRRAR